MIVQVTVLVVLMTVSTVKAQDTLRIKSLKQVDVCSGEISWLMSLSLGTINFSDSLESFDISIGYDRTVIRPSAVLKEGTLSAQMSNGPILNVIVPNEMRVYGFNIARSVAGSLPLFAVAGEFIGDCNAESKLTLPFEPDFNGEFKRKFMVRRYDSITAINKRIPQANSGCEFFDEAAVIKETDTATSTRLRLKNLSEGSLGKYKVVFQLESLSDTSLMRIDSLFAVGCRIDSVSTTSAAAVVYVSEPTRDEPEITVVVKRRAMESSGRVRMSAALLDETPCGCSLPTLKDTVEISIDRPNVNVSTSADDDACTISLRSGEVQGVCVHSGMKTLALQDLMGRVVQQIETDSYLVVMSTSNMSSGMYFVTLNCNERHAAKLIAK